MDHQVDFREVSAAELFTIARDAEELSVVIFDIVHLLEADGVEIPVEIKVALSHEDGSETFTLQAKGDQDGDGRPEGERAPSPQPSEVKLVPDEEGVDDTMRLNFCRSDTSGVDNDFRASDCERGRSRLVVKYSCDSFRHYLLASILEKVDYKSSLDHLQKARRCVENEECRCEGPLITRPKSPNTHFQYVDPEADGELGHRVLIFCPKHSLLPAILLRQALLQRWACSESDAMETLEKALVLAYEPDADGSWAATFELVLLQMLIRDLRVISQYMGGSFSSSMSKLNKRTLQLLEKHIESMDRKQDGSSSNQGPASQDSWCDVFTLKRFKLVLEANRREDLSKDHDHVMHRLLKNAEECLANFERIYSKGGTEKTNRCFFLAHLDILIVLDMMKKSERDSPIKHHYREAVRYSRLVYSNVDQDICALDMQVCLGSYAIHPAIDEYEEAEVLFKGVIRGLEKSLRLLASMSVEHALRLYELHRHVYGMLTYTYFELAIKSKFEAYPDGSWNLAGPSNRLYPNEVPYMRKSLLWAERSKGRLLSKLLDSPSPTSTPEKETGRVPMLSNDDLIHHSPRSKGISETQFHDNDDWAMDFLFKGEKYLHHGSKMLFIVYTMMGRHMLGISLVNGEDGNIHAFGMIKLDKAIEENVKRLAEGEMEELIERPSALYATNNPGSRMRFFNPWISGIVARIQRLASEAQSNRGDKATCEENTAEINRLLVKLYNVLLPAGVVEEIRKTSETRPGLTLVFVPHEDLSIVPFSALRDKDGEDGKYLIEKYPVCVSPSMWLTRHCHHLYYRQIHTPSGPELLVGRKSGYPKPNWKDLRKAHEEIASIKEKCGPNAIEILDSADSAEKPMKDRVVEHAATASWAHFAVHGEVSSEFPQGSLLLGHNETTRLTPDEISAAGPLCARSVVLSACQSGLGTLGGDGVLGFARAFVRAGVPSCVLSMWIVHEGFCLGFMQQLYKHLHDGEDLAHAMQKSTLYMMEERTKPDSKRPYKRHTDELKWLVLDWAAFTCIGYPGVKAPDHSDDEKRLYEEAFRRPHSVKPQPGLRAHLPGLSHFLNTRRAQLLSTQDNTNPTATQAQLPKGQVDLAPFITWKSVQCLNQNEAQPFDNALKDEFKENDKSFLESAHDDPQLLLVVSFSSVVKLHSLMITGPPANSPKTLRLFVNKPDMDFSNATKDPATDMVVVSLENLQGKPIPLKQVKFQKVTSLTLFIEDNQEGGEITQLQKLVFIGCPLETTDMKYLSTALQNDVYIS